MRFPLASLKMLAALGALAALAHAGDYTTWARYRPVTLSTVGMGLSANVTNVPILVRFKVPAHNDMLDSATQVQADGSDIRVTLADGTTDVPFEIEHLATGPNGRLHLWILASSVTANNPAAASFRVYWGKTGQTSMSNPTATFPTSAGYQAVFHLNDTGATIFNSANPALNGTATGTAITTGQAAGNGFVSAKGGLRVRRFGNDQNGVDNSAAAANYIQFSPAAGHVLSTQTSAFTFEAWIYSSITNSGNTSPGTKHIIAHGDGNTGGKAWFARTADPDGFNGQNHYSAGGPNNIAGPIAPFGEQHHWQFVTAVWNGTNWAIYRQRENDFWNNPTVAGPEGMLPDSAKYKIIPGTAPAASTLPWFIGGASDNTGANITRGWQGWMDEVRISTVARDSNYVKLAFLTSRADTLGGVTHPVSIGSAESPSLAGPYAAWSGHRSIVLNTSATGANVSTDVTNFPVLIRLGANEAPILAAANGGNSIRFSKADNATPLPYEIESWSANAAAIWVKVDTIKGNNSTQTIRMHWGNAAAADSSNGAAVFDTANGYIGVWHLGNPTGAPQTTARPNAAGVAANNATPQYPSSTHPGPVVTGIIGMADTLRGQGQSANGDYFHLGSIPATNFPNGLTMSMWVKPSTYSVNTTAEDRWIQFYTIGNRTAGGTCPPCGGNGNGSNSVWFGRTGSGAADNILGAEALNGTTTGTRRDGPAGSATPGEWMHLSLTLQGTGDGSLNLYRNGTQILTNTNNSAALQSVVRTANFIGRSTWNDWTLAGVVDEVRLHRVRRSAAWAKLEYENQKAVNSLVDIGLPLITVPAAPTGVTATADTGAVKVTWVAPADNGGSPILSYKATVVGDTTLACESTTLTCTITGLNGGVPYNIVVKAINAIGAGPNSSASNTVIPIVSILPGAFVIQANGNPYTYRLPASAVAMTERLTMTITNLQGKRIWSRTINPSATMRGELTWDGRTSAGQSVAPGMYVVRIQAVIHGKTVEAIGKGIKQ